MKKIKTLLKGLNIEETRGEFPNFSASKIVFDSRKAEPNAIFVAVRGTQADGHNFISKVIEMGVKAVVCEKIPTKNAENADCLFIRVKDSGAALGILAANFFDNPSEKFKLVGVTGTNGKTTTATLLFDLFTDLGYKCGLISTIEYRVAGNILPSTHTTPDPIALNSLMAEMVDSGVEYAFMEVSSHAIQQNRIAGLHFVGGIFSNITHDHLDYHKTFDAYIRAKKTFFDNLPKSAFALTNADERNGAVMLQNTQAQKFSYGLKKIANFKAKIIENALSGLHLELDGFDFHARLIGEFNAYNLTAVYATAVILGVEKTEILTALSNLKGAEGRFEYIRQTTRDLIGIVDYAHTPDALEKVLETIIKLRTEGQRIICLTGCGGDRDPAKRKLMGKIGATLSDILILTADNPRTEDPLAIIADMHKGISAELEPKVLEIPDRRQAIKTAVKMAQKGDIILLAGKGHEKYQDINGVKYPFDDKAQLKEAFE
jgi:UDP-N-acetylmuramoyl-L-alanyl-D-glutamate--2,6-diaminopimelate ligase